MHIYSSHLSGLYTSPTLIDTDDLYCESCGDFDWYIGEFADATEFLKFYADLIDYEGSGGVSFDHVYYDICSELGNRPSWFNALKIVGENKTVDEDEGDDDD